MYYVFSIFDKARMLFVMYFVNLRIKKKKKSVFKSFVLFFNTYIKALKFSSCNTRVFFFLDGIIIIIIILNQVGESCSNLSYKKDECRLFFFFFNNM